MELEEKILLLPEMGSYGSGKVMWMNTAALTSDIYDGLEQSWSRYSGRSRWLDRGEETLVVATALDDANKLVYFNILMPMSHFD